MRCPYCAGDNTQVKDSRPTDENAAIRHPQQAVLAANPFALGADVALRPAAEVVFADGKQEGLAKGSSLDDKQRDGHGWFHTLEIPCGPFPPGRTRITGRGGGSVE